MAHHEASYSYALDVWKAEEENARRLTAKKALVAGLPGAILAFVGLTGDAGRDVVTAAAAGSIASYFSAFFFTIGISSLVASIVKAVGIRRSGVPVAPMASTGLHPADGELELLASEDDEAVRRDATVRLFAAARCLREANRGLSVTLQRALEWLFSGIVFLVLAFLVYILVRSPVD